MLFIRSIVFNIAFYANLIVWMLLLLPTLVMPRKILIRCAQGWARSNLLLLRVIAGTKIKVRGLSHIPPGGLLVGAKHQSLWETFALLPLFDDPAYIYKRELGWIPLFGWYLWKARCVPVDRSAGSQALIAMTERAKEAVARGQQILLFPEGTRRPPGAPPAYKYGIAHLYSHLAVPCLPVALNSGLFWPRRDAIRRKGTIVIEILKPIAPGLSKEVLFKDLQNRIEEASDRLLQEGRRELDKEYLTPTP